MTNVAVPPSPPSAGVYAPPAPRAATPGFRAGAVCGLVAAITLVAGIVAIMAVPDFGNVAALDRAIAEIHAHTRATIVAGWMFALSLVMLVPYMRALAATADPRCRPLVDLGALLVGIGALLDVVGSLGMVTLGHFVVPAAADASMHAVGVALLASSIVLDAAFNFFLGVGLLCLGYAAWRGGFWPRWLTGLTIAGGVLALPQAYEWRGGTIMPLMALSSLVSVALLLGGSWLLWERGAVRES